MGESEITRLEHLTHHRVRRSADAFPLVGLDWTVFHFEGLAREKKPKAVLYGRMWRFREQGMDAMVRQVGDEYVLVARRFN